MHKLIESLVSSRALRVLFWLLAAFSLLMALLPSPPATPFDRFGDKFEHMLAFGTLTVAGLFAWPRTPRWRLALYLSLFGALIEVLQAFPRFHRDCDPRDWVADTLAILVVMAVSWVLRRFARA